MKLYDENNLCWADVLFWGLVVASICVGGYGIILWAWNFIIKY